MKTVNEILTDVRTLLLGTPIAALSGGIYKRIRPTDSNLQDTVIDLITGVKAKFLQDGALTVKIFYEDIYDNNTYYEDSATGEILENLLIDLSEELYKMNDYSFELSSRETYTSRFKGEMGAESQIHQHYAILKMNFQLTYN
jgi:hypothetical protein